VILSRTLPDPAPAPSKQSPVATDKSQTGDAANAGGKPTSRAPSFADALAAVTPGATAAGAGTPLPASTAGATATVGATTPAVTPTPASTAGIADFLAGLPAFLSARADEDDTDVGSQSATSGKRKADPKSDVPTGDAAQTVGAASVTTPDASLLSGLFGLAPAAATASTDASAALAGKASLQAADTTAADGAAAIVSAEADSKSAASLVSAVADQTASSSNAAASAKSAGSETALAPIIKSVTVETQLAPSPELSPMQQVIDTVQKLATGTDGAASIATTTVTTTPAPSVPSRTMTLVLEPDNLGSVTIKMQLRDGTLDLQLDVANSETLGLLTKDKDSLAAAMSGQDYQVGTLTLRASDTQTASQGNDNGSQSSNQSNASSFQDNRASQDGRASQNGDDGAGGSSNAGGGRAARDESAKSSDDQSARRDSRSLSSNGSAGVYI
jgi:flagellar hook-length control protein FliK